MSQTESKLIETLTGRGTLSHEGTPLAQATYRLEVRQNITVTFTNMGEHRKSDKPSISGILDVVSGDIGFPPLDSLVLTTEDGLRLALIFDLTSLLGSHFIGISLSYSVTAMPIKAP